MPDSLLLNGQVFWVKVTTKPDTREFFASANLKKIAGDRASVEGHGRVSGGGSIEHDAAPGQTKRATAEFEVAA